MLYTSSAYLALSITAVFWLVTESADRKRNFASGSVAISGCSLDAIRSASCTLLLYQSDAFPDVLRAAIASNARASDIRPSLLVSVSILIGDLITLFALSCKSLATYPVVLPFREAKSGLYSKSITDSLRALPLFGTDLPPISM